MTTARFLPWMKTGLAATFDVASQNDVLLVEPTVEVLAGTADSYAIRPPEIRLRGPGDVLALKPGQIKRRDPEPGSEGAEPHYFCSVEFFAPDLPWRYTPYSAVNDQLTPWLVLVVVELGSDVALDTSRGTPTLTVTNSSEHLPNLDEAWAWAHVQGDIEPSEKVVEAFTERPDAFTSRLLCPRRLDTDTNYTACLVPTFENGRRAGLGNDPGSPSSQFAWEQTSTKIVLPVYESWQFSAGDKVDFKKLAKRIRPDEVSATVGFRDLDLSDPGVGIDSIDRPATFVGAMYSPAGERVYWANVQDEAAFTEQVRARIDAPPKGRSSRKYKPLVHDPAVAPPVYGSVQVGSRTVPQSEKAPGWFEDLNLGPQHRSVAGLGAEVIRADQESLMAAAWEETRQAIDVNRELNRSRLAHEAAVSAETKLDSLSDGELVAIASPALATIRHDGTTAKRLMLDGDAPSAYFGASFRRLGRANGPLATKADSSAARSPAIAITEAVLAAGGGDSTIESPLSTSFRQRYLPAGLDVGAGLASAVTDAPLTKVPRGGPTGLGQGFVNRSGRVAHRRSLTLQRRQSVETLAQNSDVSIVERFDVPSGTIGKDVVLELDELQLDEFTYEIVRPIVEGRIPVTNPGDGEVGIDLAGVSRDAVRPAQAILSGVHTGLRLPSDVATSTIPTRIGLEPRFTDAMYERLRALAVDYLVPGVGEVRNNSLGLLALNPAFIEAFLVGLNHEMSRELRWREYPAALNQTWFQHFFDRVDAESTDIDPIDTWHFTQHLGNLFSADLDPDDPALVLLIKADLLRKFPDVRVYAVAAMIDDDGNRVPSSEPDAAIGPTFVGSLQRGVNFYGFLDLTESEARGDGAGDGYFFVFEEEPRAMRFGLDLGNKRNKGNVPQVWENLTWSHLADAGQPAPIFCPIDLGARDFQTPNSSDEVWGSDAADMAAITFRKPIQVFMHATSMLPES